MTNTNTFKSECGDIEGLQLGLYLNPRDETPKIVQKANSTQN